MATKSTCLVSQRRLQPLFVLTLALPAACAETPKEPVWAVADSAVAASDAGGATTGGGLGGGGLTDSGLSGGGIMGGGTTGGGTTGGGTTGGGTTGGGTTGGGVPGGGVPGGGVDSGDDAGSDAGPPDSSIDPDGGTLGGGGFPRTGEAVNVALQGPYATANYEGPASAVIDSSRIYYPTNAVAPFAIMALSPGFTNVKEDFLWWGPVMASHGFVIAVLSPTSSLDFPGDRADDLEAGVMLLKGENARSGSPLLGKIDVSRAAVLGHSMGGGATLLLMQRAASKYQAAVAWEPWESLDTDRISAPTMILAGEVDLVAGANDMAWPFYQGIPNTTKKAYAEFAGLGHNTPNNLGSASDHELHAKWTIAWMKMQLENDIRYDAYVKNEPELSRFARSQVQ